MQFQNRITIFIIYQVSDFKVELALKLYFCVIDRPLDQNGEPMLLKLKVKCLDYVAGRAFELLTHVFVDPIIKKVKSAPIKIGRARWLISAGAYLRFL